MPLRHARTIKQLPSRDVVAFDGECRFCRFWVPRADRWTAFHYEWQPSQSISKSLPEIPKEDFDAALQLAEADGKVYAGADALVRMFTLHGGWRAPWCRFFSVIPGAMPLLRSGYTVVAKHRTFFSMLSRLVWGRTAEGREIWKD